MLSQELSKYLAKRSERFEYGKRPKLKHGVRADKLLAQANARVKSQLQTQSKQPEDFLGIPCKRVVFKVPPKADREAMRTEFEQVKRVEFIKFLAETQQDALKKASSPMLVTDFPIRISCACAPPKAPAITVSTDGKVSNIDRF